MEGKADILKAEVAQRSARLGRAIKIMAVTVIATTAMAGCAARPLEIGREPELSPVGAGISRPPREAKVVNENLVVPARDVVDVSTGSLWRDRGADLFKDPRARRVGDILTVSISMKDRASFDNSSKRSRDASHGFGLSIGHDIDWRGFASAATAKADSSIKSNTSTDGKGEIARSENIDLRIAAVVTDVLPNGNLLI